VLRQQPDQERDAQTVGTSRVFSEMLRLVATGCLLVQCSSFVAPESAVCSSTQAVQLQKASLGQRSSACVLHAESADAAAFNVQGSAPDGWIETP
jgi:hypothetical protein